MPRDRSLASIAHHEAGHFVARFRLIGDHHHSISIEEHDENAGSSTGDYPVGSKATRVEIEAAIVTAFAGFAAQVRFAPDGEIAARAAASGDDETASEFLDRFELQGEERTALELGLRERASTFVAEHWGEIAALAAELIHDIRLDGDEASLIVDVAAGKEGAAEALANLRLVKSAP